MSILDSKYKQAVRASADLAESIETGKTVFAQKIKSSEKAGKLVAKTAERQEKMFQKQLNEANQRIEELEAVDGADQESSPVGSEKVLRLEKMLAESQAALELANRQIAELETELEAGRDKMGAAAKQAAADKKAAAEKQAAAEQEAAAAERSARDEPDGLAGELRVVRSTIPIAVPGAVPAATVTTKEQGWEAAHQYYMTQSW